MSEVPNEYFLTAVTKEKDMDINEFREEYVDDPEQVSIKEEKVLDHEPLKG